MPKITTGSHVFESGCELVDVTSNNRPDTSWRYTDAKGHNHRWFIDGVPAEWYSPSAKYSVQTLQSVIDGVGYWEDGEPYTIWHYECAQCGERIEPRYTADQCVQMMPGLRWYKIDSESVSQEEFQIRIALARR